MSVEMPTYEVVTEMPTKGRRQERGAEHLVREGSRSTTALCGRAIDARWPVRRGTMGDVEARARKTLCHGCRVRLGP